MNSSLKLETLKKNKISIILRSVGIIIFIYIILKIDLSELIKSGGRVNGFSYSLSMLLTIALIPLRGFRWNFLKNKLGFQYTLTDSIRSSFLAYAVSSITPGRVGEFSKLLFLKGENNKRGILLSIYIDRMFDLLVLFLVSFLIEFFFPSNFVIETFQLSFLSLVAFLAIFSGVFLWAPFSETMISVLKYLTPKIPIKFMQRWLIFNGPRKKLDDPLKMMVSCISFTLLILLVQCIRVYILSEGIGLDVPVIHFFILVPIMLIINLLPISISGLGTRETVFILFLGGEGVSVENAVVLSLLVLSQGVFLATLSSIYLTIYGRAISLKKLKEKLRSMEN